MSFFGSLQRPHVFIPGLLVLGVVMYAAFLISSGEKIGFETVILERSSLRQEVNVTGKVKPIQSVDLAFTISGRVALVEAVVGDTVESGGTLVRLEAHDLIAALGQANANLAAQVAKLEGLKAGSRPEDVRASEAALSKARQDLENMYAGISDTLAGSYAKGNDAVRTQLNAMFSNADTSNPLLTFQSTDSQAVNNALSLRVAATGALTSWQTELITVSSLSATTTLEMSLGSALIYLDTIKRLLIIVSDVVNKAANLSDATIATYKANVTTALNDTNTAISNLNSASQSISSQRILVERLAAETALKRAGSTVQEIATQTALVAASKADVDKADAQLEKTTLRAPFSGIVTKQDAKLGQTVTANETVVSLLSSGGFHIEVFVPEADIAKVILGNSARITLDAYSEDEVFSAKVVSIDPAETVFEGVSTYKISLAFVEMPREVKSGMTANVDILTALRDNVLAVPGRAIITRGDKKFVRVLTRGEIVETPVSSGLRGSVGTVEILSGLKEGDEVIVFINE